MSITLRVNGKTHTVDVDPTTPLLYVLRNDLDLHGPRFGCGLGQCGACTVLIKGEAVRSCVRPVSAVQGAEITTLEGLAKDGKLHPVQQAWIDEQVPQCGFCQNGQILTAKALLDRNPNPTDAEIRAGHAGRAVPLHDVLPRPGRHQARGEGDGRHADPARAGESARMTATRRDFLKSSGMLVVGFSAVSIAPADAFAARRGAGRGRRSVSRSRLPAARFVDRHPRGQHRDVLRRQDRSRSGHGHGLPADHVRRARHRLRQAPAA